jgi:hypothetical protein
MTTALCIIAGTLLTTITILAYIASKLDSRGYDGCVIDYRERSSLLEMLL